jgi:hypothetical protein
LKASISADHSDIMMMTIDQNQDHNQYNKKERSRDLDGKYYLYARPNRLIYTREEPPPRSSNLTNMMMALTWQC